MRTNPIRIITFLFVCILFASFCNGQSIVGNWRKITRSQSILPSDSLLRSGDLAIKSDSSFIMQGDKSAIVGTWTSPSKNKLEFWCEPKKEMIKIHLNIVEVTENELVLKLNGSKVKYKKL